jgi:hypothetical protein
MHQVNEIWQWRFSLGCKRSLVQIQSRRPSNLAKITHLFVISTQHIAIFSLAVSCGFMRLKRMVARETFGEFLFLMVSRSRNDGFSTGRFSLGVVI